MENIPKDVGNAYILSVKSYPQLSCFTNVRHMIVYVHREITNPTTKYMEFAHITKTKNGEVIQEVIEITYTDVRYPSSQDFLHLTLEDANKLSIELQKFLAPIPY